MTFLEAEEVRATPFDGGEDGFRELGVEETEEGIFPSFPELTFVAGRDAGIRKRWSRRH